MLYHWQSIWTPDNEVPATEIIDSQLTQHLISHSEYIVFTNNIIQTNESVDFWVLHTINIGQLPSIVKLDEMLAQRGISLGEYCEVYDQVVRTYDRLDYTLKNAMEDDNIPALATLLNHFYDGRISSNDYCVLLDRIVSGYTTHNAEFIIQATDLGFIPAFKVLQNQLDMSHIYIDRYCDLYCSIMRVYSTNYLEVADLCLIAKLPAFAVLNEMLENSWIDTERYCYLYEETVTTYAVLDYYTLQSVLRAGAIVGSTNMLIYMKQIGNGYLWKA